MRVPHFDLLRRYLVFRVQRDLSRELKASLNNPVTRAEFVQTVNGCLEAQARGKL